jgi:hypothetical protein
MRLESLRTERAVGLDVCSNPPGFPPHAHSTASTLVRRVNSSAELFRATTAARVTTARRVSLPIFALDRVSRDGIGT